MMAAANSIFNQCFVAELSRSVPDLSPTVVIGAGATGFRKFVEAKDLPAVLQAYSIGIGRVFCVVAALGALSVFVSLFVGLTDLRKKIERPEPSHQV